MVTNENDMVGSLKMMKEFGEDDMGWSITT